MQLRDCNWSRCRPCTVVHATISTAKYPHARILSLDTAKAQTCTGA
jgi:hypothetical protein